MEQKILGIDIGGSYVKYGVFSLEGTLLKRSAERTPRELNGEDALKTIAAFAKSMVDPSEVAGVGIGVPAPVTDGKVGKIANLRWEALNVDETFKRFFGGNMPVVVENDASLAAFGEYTHGAFKEEPYVFITLGTGVGGGIVIGGELLRGAAGEIGHTTVVQEGEQCGCGKRGCLEAYAGTAAMKAFAKTLIDEGETTVLKDKRINARNILDAAKAGDAVALKVVERAADALAQAVANVSALLNPSSCIFGGGVAEAGEFLFEKINERLDRYLFFGNKKPILKKACLGNDAGITGAMEMVRHVQSDS